MGYTVILAYYPRLLPMCNKYHFCMEETWEHVSMHWQEEGIYQLWRNIASCAGTQFRMRTMESQGNSATHIMPCVLTTRPWPTHQKNGLALAVFYHTPGTASRLWAGASLHWAAYTWHWHIDIISLWRKHGNMSLCTGSRANASYGWIASCAGTQFQMQAPESQGNSTTH